MKHGSGAILTRLLALHRPYAGWLALGVFLSLVANMANVALMAVSGWFIASMALAGIAGVQFNYFMPSAGIRGFAILRITGRYGERLVTHEATFRVITQIRVWFYERIEPLAPAGLQGLHSGDLLSRLRADVDRLDRFYLSILLPLSVALLAVTAFMLFLAWRSPMAALVNLIGLLTAGIGFPLLVNHWASAAGERMVATESALRADVIDGVQGLAELMAYGADEAQAARFRERGKSVIHEQQTLATLNASTQAVLVLSAGLTLWFGLLVTIPMVADGALNPANIAMIALFSLATFETVTPLPQALSLLGATLASARRLFSLVDEEPQVAPSANPVTQAVSPGRIEFNEVFFGYSDRKPVLDNLSLRIEPGQRVAILGATGSGKSTLINLLQRFWAADVGQVHYGDVDILDWDEQALRQDFAVVAQNAHIFNATLRENLLLANPMADEPALLKAMQQAGLADLLEQIGLDGHVGEAGHKLSGGQRKRLALARALLRDCPVMMLDEPGEGLDARTEQSLIQDLQKQSPHQTRIFITHRFAGLEDMDQILVLDQGNVIEQGTHQQLMAQNGLYRRMRSL